MFEQQHAYTCRSLLGSSNAETLSQAVFDQPKKFEYQCCRQPTRSTMVPSTYLDEAEGSPEPWLTSCTMQIPTCPMLTPRKHAQTADTCRQIPELTPRK